PVAQWLRTKLLFRAGRTDQAGALLANVAAWMPMRDSEISPASDLKDNLGVPDSSDLPAAWQVRAELGVFHLARGQYAQALDDFMQAGVWIDAAYVAERVLTLDELKVSVDRGTDSADELRSNLRYLLARRLTRELRGNEARPYYPAEWQLRFDEISQALQTG